MFCHWDEVLFFICFFVVSFQDTVMALQAISEYSVTFSDRNPSGNIVITPIAPSASPIRTAITAENAAVLQIFEVRSNASGFLH